MMIIASIQTTFIALLNQLAKLIQNIFCRWENAENGEFRIVDTSMVSKLWGSFKTTKQNKKMNFEKLSRAMR